MAGCIHLATSYLLSFYCISGTAVATRGELDNAPPSRSSKKKTIQGKIIVSCDTKKKEQNKEELKLGAE